MNIKRASAKALADALAVAVPAFSAGGGVLQASADFEDPAKYPTLVVVPRQLTFNPWQEDDGLLDVEDDPASEANNLVHVGDFEGLFELRLYALTPYERGELSQSVLDAFMADQPGQLVAHTANISLGGVATLYQSLVVANLDTEEWREEMALTKKRFSYLDLQVSFPALSMRTATTIEEIQLYIARDLTSTVDEVDDPRAIDENGQLSEFE